jgi:hypothetical protein
MPRRRSIVDRLRAEAGPVGPARPEAAEGLPPAPVVADPRQAVRREAGRREAGRLERAPSPRRPGRGPKLAAIFGGVVAAGLGAGAATAWLSGWRPAFLAPAPEKAVAAPANPVSDAARPGEAKPGAPPKAQPPASPPAPPPSGALAKSCFAAVTEVKAGAAACGFALDAAGAVSVKGKRLADRLVVAAKPARRLVLYPVSPSGRFAVFRACDAASGGRCPLARLIDTETGELRAIGAGAGFSWVAWSPKERVGLLGYRQGAGDAIAAIAAASGKTLRASLLHVHRNQYVLIRRGSVRWRDDRAFTVEAKYCTYARGRQHNRECERNAGSGYRRHLVKVPD